MMNLPAIGATIEVQFVAIDRSLIHLAQGWRFSDDIAQPMPGNHGNFSVLMERDFE